MTENEREHDRIIAECTETLESYPDDANALSRRGWAWNMKKEYDNAIADFCVAIRLDPKSADAYHNRGNAWVYLGKLRKGIADFTQAIHLDPCSSNCAVTYSSRGVAWRRKGRYAEALADYERALELDPHSAQRHAVLAEFLALCPQKRFRDGARALELITEACELADYNNADYFGCVAAAYAEQGDFLSAISFQKEAFNLATEDDDKEDMRLYIECYEAGVSCWMQPPTWRERWA